MESSGSRFFSRAVACAPSVGVSEYFVGFMRFLAEERAVTLKEPYDHPIAFHRLEELPPTDSQFDFESYSRFFDKFLDDPRSRSASPIQVYEVHTLRASPRNHLPIPAIEIVGRLVDIELRFFPPPLNRREDRNPGTLHLLRHRYAPECQCLEWARVCQ
ncbi:hypothetical protein BJ508DRAFT_127670 [Ascobolus immersus RN42]|uniref:Uncharacterized protein n=1 Tax=Ascobolus immersus RN42 TaxID=1160509 RepID=A0A3N4I336_ASCIM|nr:hypothetical protein BJ508DRAFT_127670 [Ascobolus immersus RN42]